jgi:hypothetical protein
MIHSNNVPSPHVSFVFVVFCCYTHTKQFDTYLINVSAGNVLNLYNNCFYSNLLQGRGLVHLADASSLGDVRQNAGSNGGDRTECDFLHVENGTKSNSDKNDRSVCVGFDQAICGLDIAIPSPTTGGTPPLETGKGPSSASGSSSPLRMFSLPSSLLSVSALILCWNSK